MEIKASIIIPTYKRHSIANQCLRSIFRSPIQDIEIILVNDDKENDFILDPANQSSAIHLIKNTGKGVAAARNSGSKIAKGPILIFVDDDMIIHNDAIEKAILFIEKNQNRTYNANWIYEPALLKKISDDRFGRFLIKNGHTTLQGWNSNAMEWKDNSLLPTEGITSQFFAIKKTVFEAVGGYNEKFPYAGFEDHDISIRLKKHGIVNYIDTRVCIFHNESDRTELKSWLERKRRGSVTRKKAVELGLRELELKYSLYKKILLHSLLPLRPVLYFSLRIIPGRSIFDPIYSWLVNILIALSIYEGYTKE